MDATELNDALANCYGTENYYKNPLYPWMKYTDGVQTFAENAGGGAYWFLDIIGTELRELARKEEFISITLLSNLGKGRIFADDGNGTPLYNLSLEYTDCPTGDYHFYLTNNVLMLTSEY
jgi:hypothetical protein